MEYKIFLFVLTAIYGLASPSQQCAEKCTCLSSAVLCNSKKLQQIPSDLPETATYVDLHDNEIKDLENEKFSHLQKLTTLILRSNQITELQFSNFAGLAKLKMLNIDNNKIERIGADTFAELSSLQDLDLTGNKILAITEAFNISSLKRLTLNKNKIPYLNDDSLRGLRNISHLMLSNNNISYISKSAFEGLTQLSYLFLQGNPLKNVDNIFNAAHALVYLDVTFCHLTNIPQALPWTLQYLMMSGNNLTIIRVEDLTSVTSLKVLSIENNQIQSIEHGVFSHLPNINHIHVSNNNLTQLPNEIPASIELFFADDNRIEHVLQSNFPQDSKLKMLSLKNNMISELAANTFSSLRNLDSLILSLNKIKVLRNMMFADLYYLRILSLESNPIEQIENQAFNQLSSLQQLKLSNIESEKISIEGIIFEKLSSLRVLDLHGSPSIVKNILNSKLLLHSLRSIQHLNMINSSLKTLSMEVKTFLPHLMYLQITENPWHCDKNLEELGNWIKKEPRLFSASYNITCATPENLKGRPLENINSNEFMDPELTVTTHTEIKQTSSASIPTESIIKTSKSNGDEKVLETDSHTKDLESTFYSYSLNITTNEQSTSQKEWETQPYSTSHNLNEQSSIKNDLLSLDTSTLSPSQTLTESSTKLKNTAVSSNKDLISASDEPFTKPGTPKTTNLASLPLTSDLVQRHLTTSQDLSQKFPLTSTKALTSITPSSQSSRITSQSTATDSKKTSLSQLDRTTYQTTSTFLSRTVNIDKTSIANISTLQTATPIHTSMTDSKIPERKAKLTKFFPQLASTATNTATNTSTTSSSEMTISTIYLVTKSKFQTSQYTTKISTEGQTNRNTLAPKTPNAESTRNMIISTNGTESFSSANTTARGEPPESSTNQAEFVKNTSFSTKDKDTYDNNDNHLVKTPGYGESRLPTFSSSADVKLRTVIIGISVSLLALVFSVFIVLGIAFYRRRKKRVIIDDHNQQVKESHTETSDTAFIIDQMDLGAGGSDTPNNNPKNGKETKNSSSSRKGKVVSRQCSSTSAASSKTSFDCVSGVKEDDSELLVYSWK